MDKQDQEKFDWLVAGWEESYFQSNLEAGLDYDSVVDNALLRTSYYARCLASLKEGPELKPREIHEALIKYFDEKHAEWYKKIPSWVNGYSTEKEK